MGVLSDNRSQIVNGGLISASFVSDLYDVFTGNAEENLSFSGSVNITGSLIGNLTGTADTASYVETAQTASYVLNAVSASYAMTAVTASHALNAVSSSYAETASYSIVTLIDSSSLATSASYAVTASYIANNLFAVSYTEVTIDNIQIASMGTSPIILLPALTSGNYYKDVEIIIESTAVLADSVTQTGGNALYYIDYGGSVIGFVNRYAFDYQDTDGNVTFVPSIGKYVQVSSFWGGDVVAGDQTYNLTSAITITTDNGLNPTAVGSSCGALVKIKYSIGSFGTEL